MARRKKAPPPAKAQPAAAPAVIDPNQPATAVPPPVQPQGIQRQLLAQLRAEFHTGPIPSPDVLIRYNDAVPNAADRIIAMAENQSAHRIRMESQYQGNDHVRSIIGTVTGLIVAMAFLGGSVLLVMNGHGIEGTVLGSVDLIGLVSVFVYGTERRRSERLERVKLMAGPTPRDNQSGKQRR